jgi:zinc protease
MRTIRLALLGGAASAVLLLGAAGAQAQVLDLAAAPAASATQARGEQLPPLPEVDIPFTRFTLDNGLTVIVHEDHRAPIVAVNIWYHVGSKNEPQGAQLRPNASSAPRSCASAACSALT